METADDRLNTPTAPGEWVTVPREINRGMMDAGQAYINSVAFQHSHTLPPQFRWVDFWASVLSASPSPPDAPRQAGVLTEEERESTVIAQDFIDRAMMLPQPHAKRLLAIISRLIGAAS
jgi:hypothetical protein